MIGGQIVGMNMGFVPCRWQPPSRCRVECEHLVVLQALSLLSGLFLAQKTLDNFVEKSLRLYEQEPPHRKMKRLGEYTHRWVGWAGPGINSTHDPH